MEINATPTDVAVADVDLEKGTVPPVSQDLEDTKSDPSVDIELEQSKIQAWMSQLLRWIKSMYPESKQRRPFRLIVRKLEGCAVGYPYLATFLDSGEDFMIYRRFGFLHSRLLLRKQNELEHLEAELDRMDQVDVYRKEDRALQQRWYDDRRTQNGKTRKQLLAQIEEILLQYDQLLLNAQHLVAANRPAERDYRSVATFFDNKKPLAEGDQDFIWRKEDLITLRPGRETSWLDSAIRKLVKWLPRKTATKIFCSKENESKTTDANLFMPTKSSVKKIINSIIVVWVITLMTVPIYMLYEVGLKFNEQNAKKSKALSMLILMLSSLCFAVGMALFTKAKRHELLAASAAYCALLVVFIANLGMDDKKA